MKIHFFTALFYFAFIWFRVQALVAASPPFLEDGILVSSKRIQDTWRKIITTDKAFPNGEGYDTRAPLSPYRQSEYMHV